MGNSLPASSEGPLSSAVMAKPKDGDDGGGRADLLMEKDCKEIHGKDDQTSKTLSSPSVGGLEPGTPRPRM